MTTDECTTLMRKGACFGCKTIGHLFRDCPHRKKKTTNNPPPFQKMKGKDLAAHVRALMAQMDEGDKDEFFANAAEEGF